MNSSSSSSSSSSGSMMMMRRSGRRGKEWYQQLIWVALVMLLFVVAITTTLKTKLLERDSFTHGFPQVLEVDSASLYSERTTKPTTGKQGPDDPFQSQLRSDSSKEGLFCDRSHPRTDVCTLKGDVRMDGQTASFILYSSDSESPIREERIKPYTRKWETSCMDIIHEVKLKSIPHHHLALNNQALCEVEHTVPAVVFTTGGYTGNLYHEFHDGLIPLYITTQQLKKEVVFIIVEFHDWWLMKYGDVIEQLSNYPVVDFENEKKIHCFPEVTVGLHIHEELGIDPSLMPGNETIRDFRAVLDRAYTELPASSARLPVSKKPKLVIIVRDGTRVFQNLDEIVALAEEVGFNVTLWKPDPTTELKRLYWTLNSSDVLMGVHGAAMTHFLFMRPGSVFIQVVPLGNMWAASDYYGQPAKRLGLQYLEYVIKPYESSLSDLYDKNDSRLTNPEGLVKKSWWDMKEIYLEHQDVRLSLTRFRKTLIKAKTKALRFMKSLNNGIQ